MKLLRGILSLLLLSAFLNVLISKTIHEVFEHEHETHACVNKELDHLHEDEVTHLDLICSFNFSSTEEAKSPSKVIVGTAECNLKEQDNYAASYQNEYLDACLLRGPPVINS